MSAVKSTFLFRNGMVVTFGHDEKQIPELQGRVTRELVEAIKARSDPQTEWAGFGEDGPLDWSWERRDRR